MVARCSDKVRGREINRERWSPDVVIRSEDREINGERWSPDVVIRSDERDK